MATYKITNCETGAVTWTEDFAESMAFEDKVDEEGCPMFDVELYCSHNDQRICEGLGH